ncbi:hypothetical protein [Coleofasciculus sp. FACHB-SPT9]|uniref:hypothetical protein n=1 Tax=Cyanophyceae TaxID=3028117 RepID=UPI0016869319|nr:hypothetical protein [Coleofasciculus sp. FACHB-SPT9]MBD1889191.1 hypothetical protein [Coleofasciculus sp. FACHB-SPT9]
MVSSNFNLRLQHLEDNIKQDLALLKKYEDAERYEDDPRRQTRYQREIDQLKESATRYQQEYDELQIQITGEPTLQMQSIAIQLQQMDTKLNTLYAGQKAIYENVNHLRKGLLNRYKSSEQHIIAVITERLDKAQIATVSSVLEALEADKISEFETQQLLQGTQQMLAVLNQRNIVLPGEQEVTETIKAPELDAKHKLRVTLPIIPLILEYEAELELGTGINLKAAWQKLVVPFRGE